MRNLTPLPGHVIVELQGNYRESVGEIVIPKRYQNQRNVVGRVQAINMTDRDRRVLGVEDIVEGDQLIMAHGKGRQIEDSLYTFPLSFWTKDWRDKKCLDSGVLGIAPADMDLSPMVEEIPRCQFCGNARDHGVNGMMLVPSDVGLICPRCNRNEQGEKMDPEEVTITPHEVEEMEDAIETAAGRKKAKGTIYSLPSAS